MDRVRGERAWRATESELGERRRARLESDQRRPRAILESDGERSCGERVGRFTPDRADSPCRRVNQRARVEFRELTIVLHALVTLRGALGLKRAAATGESRCGDEGEGYSFARA